MPLTIFGLKHCLLAGRHTFDVLGQKFRGRCRVMGVWAGILLACGSSASASWWTCLYNTGSPVFTYTLGDKLAYQFEFAVNQDTTGWTVQYGLGTSTDGTGWTWRNASYSRNDGNTVWISKQNEHQFTSTGNWSYSGLFNTGGYTEYASAGWVSGRTTLSASSYFTVNALTNVTSYSAATNASHATNQVDLSWTKDGSHYTMVVRKLHSQSWTEPSQGIGYSQGAAIGQGTNVYFGSGSSANDAVLLPDTSYDYKFYTENNSYFSAGATVNGVITMATEPTAASSNMSFSSVTPTGMTVGWARGNGANVLVVGRLGTAPSADPSDLTGYTASSTFGSGTALGNGYVVYNGSGTSVSVGNLAANTNYYFAAYEYNGVNATNYLTGSKLSGNKVTLFTEPTTSPTVGAFTAISGTGMTVNWSGGNGTNVIVLVKRGGAVDSNPVDGTTYTTNSAFGSGTQVGTSNFVVYAGAAAGSAPVTGLSAGQTYYVAAYAYNGSGGSENYLTSSPGTGSTNTPLTAPGSSASNITVSALSASGMTVGFAPGNGAYHMVVMRSGGAVNWGPTDNIDYSAGVNTNFGSATDQGSTGSKIVSYSGGTSVTVGGLSAGTTYSMAVYEYNSSGSLYAYYTNGAPVSNATTWASEPTTQPSGLSVSSVSSNSFSVGWSTNGDGASRMVLVKQGGTVDSFPADATAYTANSAFGSGSVLGSGNTVVYSGSGGSVTVTGLTPNTPYAVAVIGFNGSSGTANYKTNSPLAGTQTTYDYAPVITRSPASITVTSMVGTAPSAQGFFVTNSGGSQLSYTLSSNAAWLALSATSGGPLAANAGVAYSASFNVAGLGACTSNGTITITSTGSGTNAAANSPQTIAVSLTLTNIPAVTAQTAAADGKEMVRLGWSSGGTVLVVYKAGTASSAPTQGTPYGVGDSCGGGSVIYKGAGTNIEHVVASGTTNNYAFYAVNGNTYSAGATASAVTLSYGTNPTEIVDAFCYTNGAVLDGSGGGSGFSGNWQESNAGSYSLSGGSFANLNGYPAVGGNKILVTPPSDNSRMALRTLATTVNTGKIYVSYWLNYAWSGANKYCGLSLMDGSTEKAFFGEIYTADQQLGITSGGDVGSSYTLTAGPGNDWLIIGAYDFAAQTLKVIAYHAGDTVPAAEPGTWSATKSSVAIGQIRACPI